MKKKYIQPTTKAVRVRIESHIAGLSNDGGENSIEETLNPTNSGNGDDVLGKEDFGW